MQITDHFPADRALALLDTMSKHFAHKIKVTSDAPQSTLRFKTGEARIVVTPRGLHLTLDAAEPEALAWLRRVVERHSLRFAHCEDPAHLTWSVGA